MIVGVDDSYGGNGEDGTLDHKPFLTLLVPELVTLPDLLNLDLILGNRLPSDLDSV